MFYDAIEVILYAVPSYLNFLPLPAENFRLYTEGISVTIDQTLAERLARASIE